MKAIIAILSIAIVTIFAAGCSSRVGASVGHNGHSHGVSAKGSTEGGVSVGAKAY